MINKKYFAVLTYFLQLVSSQAVMYTRSQYFTYMQSQDLCPAKKTIFVLRVATAYNSQRIASIACLKKLKIIPVTYL